MEKFTLDETALAEVIKHSLWSVFCKEFSKTTHKVSLTSDEFQSFYSYCSEHEQDLLKIFVKKNLFTKDLQEIAVQMKYNLIIYEALVSEKFSAKISNEQLVNLDDKIIKLYLEQNPIAEEEVQTAIENKNFLLLKYALKYSKAKIMVTDRKFFWEFFRATEYTSESIEYSPQIEAGIFLPENENLMATYSENKFRYKENEKFFLNSSEVYPDLIWKYAQKYDCELSLNQRLTIYKNTDGKCDNILSQSEYLYHIRVPEVLRTGKKLDTVEGFSKEVLDRLCDNFCNIFDINDLNLEELSVLAIHTEMTRNDVHTIRDMEYHRTNGDDDFPIYSSDKECLKIWKKIINIFENDRLIINSTKQLSEYGPKSVPGINYYLKYGFLGIDWIRIIVYLNKKYHLARITQD